MATCMLFNFPPLLSFFVEGDSKNTLPPPEGLRLGDQWFLSGGKERPPALAVFWEVG